jgi:phage recombination protein Bet
MSTTQQNVPATQDREKGKTTYKVAGEDVTLSHSIVRNFLTKGNGKVTDQDLTQFIGICKYNQLNPFLNEAFLIKFGDKNPAQMVVSKEALMKRAEQSAEYDGFKAGLIIKRGNDIIEVEGSFSLSTDILLGGWAVVYRKDREFPYVSRVSLSEYDSKQVLWNEKKSTMIRKTAIVQALREAFPTQLGAMYTAEEQGVQDVPYEDVTGKVKQEVSEKANTGTPLSFAETSDFDLTTGTEDPRTEAQQQGKQPDF